MRPPPSLSDVDSWATVQMPASAHWLRRRGRGRVVERRLVGHRIACGGKATRSREADIGLGGLEVALIGGDLQSFGLKGSQIAADFGTGLGEQLLDDPLGARVVALTE